MTSSPREQLPPAALWAQFKGSNLERVAILGRAAEALENVALDEDLRQEAVRAAHQLAGSLGTFGFPKGTVLARETEKLLREAAQIDAHKTNAVHRLHELVGRLARELDGEPTEWQLAPSSAAPAQYGARLLVVEDDVSLALSLIAEATARGFRAERAIDPASAWAAMAAAPPDVLLLDLSFPVAAEDGLVLLARMSERRLPVSVVVLTGRDCFVDRVEVARHGGRGFLQKPLPAWRVLDVVTDLVHKQRVARARILAIDDDPQILHTLRALLEPEGLVVTTEDDPLHFWHALDDTAPDILILDFDMPLVSGIELCQVVRNDPRWATLPILFLSGRVDADSIHQMFGAGADDFVSKPIVGPELVTRITNRLERTRLLREMAETDYLTGLPNRRRSGQDIDRMLRLAERHGQPFSLAILDLDKFKNVNDEHGHATGDEVLRRIGEVLLSAFRNEDVVGRWGGEEFVVGMYSMGRQDGVERLAGLLETLRQEKIAGPRSSFSVTFSAGVAAYPEDGADLPSLYRSADKALYEAKARGRDRVLPAGWTADTGMVDVALGTDDLTLGQELLQALQRRGCTARWQRDVQGLIEQFGGPSPTLSARVVLLDAALPGDGDACRIGLAGISVILLGESEGMRVLQEGAFDHVSKPWSIRLLLQSLRRALSYAIARA